MARGARHHGGFTLLELVLVMVIITVVLSMAAPMMRGWSRGTKLRDTADEFMTAARKGRIEAVSSGTVHRLMLEPSSRRFWVVAQQGQQFVALDDSLARGTVPEEFQIQWVDQPSIERGFVEFQPNGRAQVARVRIWSEFGEQIEVECATPAEGFRVVTPEDVR